MPVAQTAERIESKIRLLEQGSLKIDPAITAYVAAAAEYDKQIAITEIKLRNGKPLTLDGEAIKDPPVTIIKDIAKGYCWEYKLRSDDALEKLRAIYKKLGYVESQLNGWQSINKHLDTGVR